MKIIEIISESLDSDVDYKITTQTSSTFETRAEIKNRLIIFRAIIEKGQEAEIFFGEVEAPKKLFGVSSNRHLKTGSGGEFNVFSFVIKSLIDFIKRYNPDVIKFGSDINEPNRATLYKKLITKYSTKMGYELKTSQQEKWFNKFVLTKK
jgi:hypothetical protein